MYGEKRTIITHEVADRIWELFNVEKQTNPNPRVMFSRAVEVLDEVLERDPNLMEIFTKKWAEEEANQEHEARK